METLSKYRLYIAGVVVLAVAALWYALSGSSASAGGYEAKAVDRGTIERLVSASGPVNAVVTVLVGTQVSGQIATLDVDYNSKVKKGQRLALIDPQSFQSKVVQAQGDLAAAKTQKALQAANLVRAQAQVEKERRVLDRLQTLSGKGFASPEQVDAQRAIMASANADVAVAKAQVDAAQANAASREAALTQAKIDLSRTEIDSPIDGIVIERNVDRGQTVAASLQAPTLFKIAQDLSQIQIEAQVDEADIGNVKQGQPVTFTVGSYAQREFHGEVSQVRVGGVNEQSVVTYTVVIAAPNRGLELLPGMTASVKIQTGRRDDVLRLPNEALRFKPPASVQAQTPSGNGAGAGQGARRRDELVAELTKTLALTPDQVATLTKTLADRFKQRGGGNRSSGTGGDAAAATPDGGGGGGGQGGGMRMMIASVIEPMLTPEQKQKLDQWRQSRGNVRRAQVWVMRGGKPVAVRVSIGIADDRFSELVGDDLKAGDEVVTRYTEPGA